MIYLDPKTDIAFKKLFGTAAHANILMSFLNSVLERKEGERIINVVINDPHNVRETPLSKASIVDVRCTDEANNQYIIEMQVVKQDVPRKIDESDLNNAFGILERSNWSRKELYHARS